VYKKVKGLPKRIVLKDAREILPWDRIFTYKKGRGKGSIAAFSNLFRYVLLFKKGGWWSYMDVVCLKYYDFPGDYIFCSQQHPQRLW